MPDQLLIPGTPPPPAPRASFCTRPAYRVRCEERWYGKALRNAWANWADFEALKPVLSESLDAYHRDPFLTDLTGKCHNPDGTLSAMLWNLQVNLQPDRSCLLPLMDFEEHFQKIFLRRGLIIYCELLLREMERLPEHRAVSGQTPGPQRCILQITTP